MTVEEQIEYVRLALAEAKNYLIDQDDNIVEDQQKATELLRKYQANFEKEKENFELFELFDD